MVFLLKNVLLLLIYPLNISINLFPPLHFYKGSSLSEKYKSASFWSLMIHTLGQVVAVCTCVGNATDSWQERSVPLETTQVQYTFLKWQSDFPQNVFKLNGSFIYEYSNYSNYSALMFTYIGIGFVASVHLLK